MTTSHSSAGSAGRQLRRRSARAAPGHGQRRPAQAPAPASAAGADSSRSGTATPRLRARTTSSSAVTDLRTPDSIFASVPLSQGWQPGPGALVGKPLGCPAPLASQRPDPLSYAVAATLHRAPCALIRNKQSIILAALSRLGANSEQGSEMSGTCAVAELGASNDHRRPPSRYRGSARGA